MSLTPSQYKSSKESLAFYCRSLRMTLFAVETDFIRLNFKFVFNSLTNQKPTIFILKPNVIILILVKPASVLCLISKQSTKCQQNSSFVSTRNFQQDFLLWYKVPVDNLRTILTSETVSLLSFFGFYVQDVVESSSRSCWIISWLVVVKKIKSYQLGNSI